MKAFVITVFAMTAMAQQPPLPTEPQIAGIVISANSEDMENAQIAKDKSTNTAIKQYALTVINEQKAATKAAGQLAEKLQISPEENETTRAIKKSTQKTRAKLKRLKGAAFDKAYINGEVELRQMMLDIIDRSLIPGAQNPDLKSLLTNERPLVEARLEQVKELQSKIK